MTAAPLRGIRACVFDAYGTIFDFASAAARCTDALGGEAARLTALWRDKQLQYSWLRAVQSRHADFWQVTGDALDFALETLGLSEPGLRDRLMQLYLALDPFPEVPEMLRQLRAAGLSTAILSNGSPEMLTAAVENARLVGLFDHVLSVELVGVYKPHPKVYRLAYDRLSLDAGARLPLSILQRLGRPRRLGPRDQDRLVQPLRPEARTPARPAGPRDQLAGRAATAPRRQRRARRLISSARRSRCNGLQRLRPHRLEA